MPVPSTYSFSNPLKTYRLWHVQEPLVGEMLNLKKPYQAVFDCVRQLCAQKPPKALDLYRELHVRLKERVDNACLSEKDVVFVTGISKNMTGVGNIAGEKPKSVGLDFFSDLMASAMALGDACRQAYQTCKSEGFFPDLDSIVIVAVAPVLIPISLQLCEENLNLRGVREMENARGVFHNLRFIPTFKGDLDSISAARADVNMLGFGTLERNINEEDALSLEGTVANYAFRESVYSPAIAEKVFTEENIVLLRKHAYVNRRITAASCETIARRCRRAYLIAGLSDYAGPTSGIFRHVPTDLYDVVGGRGGVMRNTIISTEGIASPSAVRIIAGFFAELWRARAGMI
ncbi:MAG: hypothetical protein HYT16_00045 [DPANN group archaeon]|nr:hypothetical protein [DPANN group archaeon]